MRYALVLLAALAAPTAGAGDAPLAKNPFVRPALVDLARVAQHETAAAAPALELRAVLLAGAGSLANVGGHMVRVGDEIEGYRLLAVAEDGALFAHGGREIHVPLQARRAPEGLASAD